MKSTIFVLMLLIGTSLNATIPNSDSLRKPWRINKEQLIAKFGNSDTSKALINFWFSNRKVGVVTTAIATPFAGFFGVPFFKAIFKNPVNPMLMLLFFLLHLDCFLAFSFCCY